MMGPAKLEFRSAQPADYPRCAQIYAAAWRSALPSISRRISLADFEAEVSGEQIELARLGGRTVAYVSVWEPDAFIHHLYVDPASQGFGVGAALVERLAMRFSSKALSLKCLTINLTALTFYRRLGFEETTDVGRDAFGTWIRLHREAGT